MKMRTNSSNTTASTSRAFSSRLRMIFRGPNRPKPQDVEAAPQSSFSPETEGYRHVPKAASSAFLRTTTKVDMFELTGSGKLNRSTNDLSEKAGGPPRPILAQRSESRLRHIADAERDLVGSI